MANCCVAKQSQRTQAPAQPSPWQIYQSAHTTPASVPLPPLTMSTFSKLCCQQQSCHGWWCCSLSLPVSLSLFYFWYFCSWAELLTRSFCVDCPHLPDSSLSLSFSLHTIAPDFGLSLFSCSGKRQYEVLHNFYLYLPCCFCHVFFSRRRCCCCCCLARC